MAIYQELLDFNKIFAQLTRPPMIVNDILDGSEEEKEKLKNTIYTYYESDTMSTVPSCDCKEVNGEFNIGVYCTNCKTTCVSPTESNLESILWMRSPNGVAPLMNPTIWYMLNNRFKVSGFEFIRWLTDPTYKPGVRTPKFLSVVIEKNYKRSYNFFVENFDDIMHTLFSIKSFSKNKGKVDNLPRLLVENREKIFSNYIPLPNRSILIVEGNSSNKYVDTLVIGAINAIQFIASVDTKDPKDTRNKSSYFTPLGINNLPPTTVPKAVDDLALRNREIRTVKAINELSSFYADYYGLALAKKPGLFRRQIFGTRAHFSFRAVISSITDKHNYDEIYIPWGAATGVLRLHILNKLTKRGYTTNDAITKLNISVQKYDPVLDEIFDELIRESPGGGIPCTLGRNPSLMRSL